MATANFHFGDKLIPTEQVFISRRHVFAMVNIKPMCPGHVVVSPTRIVKHFRDLTELEVLELHICAKEIAKKFEDNFKVRSFNFIIQDGADAGQTI